MNNQRVLGHIGRNKAESLAGLKILVQVVLPTAFNRSLLVFARGLSPKIFTRKNYLFWVVLSF